MVKGAHDVLRGMVFGILAMACTVSAVAQPGASQPIFRTGIDIVRLDVAVLDRDRRPVRGLKADDFVVLVDGKPQPVVTFSAVDIQAAGEPVEGWRRDIAADVATNQLDTRRIVVILMDDGMTRGDPSTAAAGRRIARAVIDRLGPDDLGAVVFTLRGRPQNFTTDRRQLIAAAETFVPKSPVAPGRFSASAHSSGNPLMAGQAPVGCFYAPGRNCLTETLKSIARVLEDTPVGRKSIVLISSGVPYGYSLEDIAIAENLADLRATLRSLQIANVNLYPFDPTGLSAEEGIVSPRLDFLRTLAESTGGRPTVAMNAPWEQVPQVFVENGSYYLLGFRPEDTAADGRFRRIAVKVRRSDVEVRTRAGYFAPNRSRRSSKTAQAATGIEKAFGAALPSGTLPVAVSVAPFALPGGKQAAVAITVGVRRPVADKVLTEKLEIRAAAFDDGFRLRGVNRQTVELTLRPHPTGERRVELQSRLTLPPGRYEVRVAAEASQSVGGVFTQVEIPSFSKASLSASGLVLGRPRRDRSDVLSDLMPVLPTAARVLSPTAGVVAFLRLYQGGKNPPRPIEIRSRIVDASDRASFEERREIAAAEFADRRSADYLLTLPTGRLAAGEHLLTIDATAGDAVVHRDVRFTVGRE